VQGHICGATVQFLHPLLQVVAELRRADTRYAESTICTHVASRMCADSPDRHGTTYEDLERLDRGLYRLRRT
jgi:hypothetical protein